jgi:hypothetical protein
MADRSRDPQIKAHIQSIASRAESDTERLTSAVLHRCWPGGTGDRSVPVALEWVRRWGPRGVSPVTQACACTGGRCHVCN